MRFDGRAQAHRLELIPRDAGQDHAIAPREHQLSLMPSVGMNELTIATQCVPDLKRTMLGPRGW